MESIVIVGSGMAGITVARELRKLDKAAALTIVSADDGRFYSKPMLSNALAGGKTPAQLAMQSAAQLAEQLNARFLTETVVERVDVAARRVYAGSEAIAYRDLVLALGADPIRLPLEGDAADGVLSVNSLHDYTRFRERLQGGQRVALLGAGLIGCEFANDLRALGCAVTVYDIAPQPLGRLLPPQAGAWMRGRLEAAGIEFRLGSSVARVDHAGDALRVTDSHGDSVEADLVLSAVGLRPHTALARDAGLAVNRGIVVDRQLCSSDDHIYAIGDCAEVEGLVLPYVMPIMNAARALAATLAHTATAVRYPAMPVVVKTPACPAVVCPPPAGAVGAWQERVSDAGVRAVFAGGDGAPLGFALLGEATAEKQALGATLPAWL